MTSFVPTVAQLGLGAVCGLPACWSSRGRRPASPRPISSGISVDPWTARRRWRSCSLSSRSVSSSATGCTRLRARGASSQPLIVAGLATGVLNALLGREAVASVPPDRAAMGSGANNTARYVGAAVGITMFVIIATHSGPDLAAGWNVAVLVSAVVTMSGAIGVALVAGARRHSDAVWRWREPRAATPLRCRRVRAAWPGTSPVGSGHEAGRVGRVAVVTPMLTEIRIGLLSTTKGVCSASRIPVATASASRWSSSDAQCTTNSSPPSRAAKSVRRTAVFRRLATSLSNLSPISWP